MKTYYNNIETVLVPTNECQTPITEELLSQYPDEVREQFMEFISTVPFIQNLISPSRPRIEELPRDEYGRAIVDITNPPIFEDADYFRQAALYFLKEGVYTKLRPNPNPNSEYRKFWDREIERCYNGLLRESDGMWIPGYLYWFLNYCPMMINEYQIGKKKAIRKEGFGSLFEGIWFRYLYLRDARENGHHAAELAKRGAHPYFQKVYTPDGIKEWREIKVGDILYGTNGVTTKVVDIPFDDLADTYKITLRDGRKVYASDDHIWNVIRANSGKVLHLNTEYLYNHYINKRKKSWRNPSGKAYIYFIPNNLGIDYTYSKVPIDSYILGILLGDGCFRNKNYKNQVIFTSAKRDIDTYKKYSPYIIDKISSDEYTYAIRVNTQYLYECNLWGCKSEDKFIPNIYKYNSRQVRLNILKGLMDTDGSVHGNTPIFNTSSKRLAEDVMEISRSLGYNCNMTTRKSGYKVKGLYKKCLNTYEVSIYGGKDVFNLERKKELIDECNITSRSYKTCITNIEYVGKYPCKCVTVDAFDNSYLIGDFVQTHNCGKSYSLASIMSKNLILGEARETNRRNITVLTAYQKEYLKDDKDGTLSKFVPILSHLSKYTPFPRLMLKQSSNEMTWQMGYKDDYGRPQGSLNQVMGVSAKDDSDKLRGKRGWILYEEFGNFNGLLELYDVTRKSVEDGDYTFACQYLIGTANNKESNFQSAKTLLYAPHSYNIQEVKNVYDKKGQGREDFAFFFPAYLNRAGCFNKDGISDVVIALLQILSNRYNAKYGADPTSVLRVIAEDPITPAEAIIKVKDAYFNVQALNERAQQLDSNPRLYDDVYVGKLFINSGGEVEFTPTNDIPIRKYPVDNDTKGALEIYNMPEKDSSNKVFDNRYIIGVDPVDNDVAESASLYSCFVFDLFTDNIVAEFTGRNTYADENFEVTRLLCKFYNAKALYESNKKGIFAYFKTMKCTHLLAETPEYLRDKQFIKYSNIGSNAYGVNASAAINNYANALLKDWFNKLIPITQTNENGEETLVQIPILYTLKTRALIEEAIQFNPEINVDRIRAMGMVMIYRQEYIIKYGSNMNAESRESLRKDDPSNDIFFTKNYDYRFKNIFNKNRM